ncbi:MAG: hypothetical protein LBS77_02450 [Desulfovibrio sp.]|jgi:hypothetical protein|nr:hypothetical protein [Desulfovibrio sp.]
MAFFDDSSTYYADCEHKKPNAQAISNDLVSQAKQGIVASHIDLDALEDLREILQGFSRKPRE